MKKEILNIGEILNKSEQKEVFGGFPGTPIFGDECSSFDLCSNPNKLSKPFQPPLTCAPNETCTNVAGDGYVCICTSALINY